ncbi:hypothetical protein N9K58_01995 [Alphaproteobacteria bacterium]|jgi:hypothetical protein|nr:hypothetical protein [Alphaproteobacteria bacterium]MDA9012408.1 hypothetical protein [Alphaproteobacteria bacterium]MDA9054732.1 hypothetical protein [Alphaproteobacteria bacterium]MDA9132022.1 hypothetical protein [Alphaproteobacteria bacterium]MDC6455257.1 hypothetical protein [Alphaproteobacteria bacterium]
MADQNILIRIMGESDIVDVTMTRNAPSNAMLMGLDAADKVNLLGHWMDQDRGAELAADKNHLDAMTSIASDILADSPLASQLEAGANFVLLTLLREKWPVGSKAKFKIIAERVKADHTYLAHICAAAKLDELDDEDSLKQEETRQLSLALAFYKANRRRFANSSAVQGLIKG